MKEAVVRGRRAASAVRRMRGRMLLACLLIIPMLSYRVCLMRRYMSIQKRKTEEKN